MNQDIPHGYCHCGCGQKTYVAAYDFPARGWEKGKPVKFVRGHSGSKPRNEPQNGNLLCKVCEKWLPVTEFSNQISKKGNLYYKNSCKSCYASRHRIVQNTLNKNGVRHRRSRSMKNKYGLLDHEYLEMIKNQNNKCAICFEVFNDDSDITIDHCHTTLKIRGLLCLKCNSTIGMARDSVEILLSAAEYLKRSNSTNGEGNDNKY